MSFFNETRAILGETPEQRLRRALGISAEPATPEQVAAIWAKAARAQAMDSFPSSSQIHRSGGSELEWEE